jgi:hypothetical protein
MDWVKHRYAFVVMSPIPVECGFSFTIFTIMVSEKRPADAHFSVWSVQDNGETVMA